MKRTLLILYMAYGLFGCGEKGSMKKLMEVEIDQGISYLRHDPHDEPEEVNGTLLTLVYDIPYFSACGIFPPLHVANQWFASGGGDGGMGPGASWEPFTISPETYAQLALQIEKTDPSMFHDSTEIFRMKFIFDTSFDHVQDRFAWSKVVCDKHRDELFKRQEEQLRLKNWE